jgi:hypothetical protein
MSVKLESLEFVVYSFWLPASVLFSTSVAACGAFSAIAILSSFSNSVEQLFEP